MSLFINTVTGPECLEAPSMWVWSPPLTVAIAFKINGADGTWSLLRTGHTGVNDNYGLTARPGYGITYDVSAANIPASSYTAGAWSHACGVSRGSTDHSAYVNGANRSDSTQSFGTPAHDRMRFGAAIVANYRQLNGWLENAAIWNVALTDEEVYALGALHVSPLLIRPQSLVSCYVDMGRYAGTLAIDCVGGYHANVVYDAPERSDDGPRTLWRPRRRLFVPAAAAPPAGDGGMGLYRTWDVRAG